jgi:hypothetical protein
MGLNFYYKTKPIIQPLAPYKKAGCCVVNGAVPHTLFMVILF